MGSFWSSKTRNRRVIGSLTELIQEAKMRLTEYELGPYQTSLRLNDTRLSFLDYGSPREVFRGLVDKMGETDTASDWKTDVEKIGFSRFVDTKTRFLGYFTIPIDRLQIHHFSVWVLKE